MQRTTLFITGTDTGVGKTVFSVLLTRHLRAAGKSVAALKLLCSGGRDDALALREALDNSLTLDEVNPWHFRAALAPVLAARKEKRAVTLAQAAAQVRWIQKRFSIIIVEGAGGLLSPLGEDFDSRDLIRELRATPVVVCPNKLGAINQVRLVLAALPASQSKRAQMVLMSTPQPDAASKTNPELLGEIVGRDRIHIIPWLKSPNRIATRRVEQTLHSLTAKLLTA